MHRYVKKKPRINPAASNMGTCHFSPVINLTLPLLIKGKMPCPRSNDFYSNSSIAFIMYESTGTMFSNRSIDK